MKKIYSIIAILAGFVFTASAADLGGKKFYLNPGHGGHDSDDRQIVLPFSEIPDFWESEGNLERGFHLRDFFEANNAKVKMSRVTNTSDDDSLLNQIVMVVISFRFTPMVLTQKPTTQFLSTKVLLQATNKIHKKPSLLLRKWD